LQVFDAAPFSNLRWRRRSPKQYQSFEQETGNLSFRQAGILNSRSQSVHKVIRRKIVGRKN
jgi:hypothetical protein